jgi:hypothetical protein
MIDKKQTPTNDKPETAMTADQFLESKCATVYGSHGFKCTYQHVAINDVREYAELYHAQKMKEVKGVPDLEKETINPIFREEYATVRRYNNGDIEVSASVGYGFDPPSETLRDNVPCYLIERWLYLSLLASKDREMEELRKELDGLKRKMEMDNCEHFFNQESITTGEIKKTCLKCGFVQYQPKTF